MDVSRMKKLFAGAAAVAIAFTQMGSAVAAYSDVPSGAWYEAAVDAFTDAGYLDANQTRFRGGDNANRAEFIKLVVELNGGILSTAPAVPSFDDVKPGFWYYGYMEEAAKEGWVKGDNNCYGGHPCYARPAANINRAEAAALIVRAFGLEATGDASSFVDVPAGQWYTSAIMTAADHCVVQGDDATGRARPADNMNRAEMVAMLHRVDQGLVFGEDCGMGNVVDPAISSVSATSVSKVEVEFNMDVDATAAEMVSKYKVTGDATLTVTDANVVDDSTVELTLGSSMNAGDDYTLSVMDMETADGETFSDTMDFSGYSPIVQGDGELEIALASTNPVGDTVPQGAVGLVLASIDLTASCDDSVVVQDITVLHEGFGDEGDIDGLYLLMDGGRISRKRTIDSQNQTSTLRLIEPMTIPACQTVTLDIAADLGTSLTAGAEHNIAIELPSDLQTNAKSVTGNFPLRGNTFRVAAVTSGQVTVEYRSVTPSTANVGDLKRVLGKFELGSNSTEDQTIYSITLEQNGTVSDGDVTNLQVRRSDGTVLTNTVATTSGDFATFTFDPPFTILQGDKVVLEVVGDIVGGSSETVSFHFEEESDLFAVGSLYGFGVNGQLYGSRVSLPTTDNSSSVTIEAGEFTIEIDGPVQQKFTADQNDAVLANVKMTTGGDAINVKEMTAAIVGTTASNLGIGTAISSMLENVELRNTRTGQTVSAVRLTAAGTNAIGVATGTGTFQLYRFDDFDAQGNDVWELRVDFIDNGTASHPLSGDQFRVHVCTQPATNTTTGCSFGDVLNTTATTTYNLDAEGISTGDEVSDIRPGGTVTGNIHRIAAPTLNVAVQSIGSTDTAVKNSKNINLLRFQARAGEAEDIRLTSAVFEVDAGTATDANNYTLWADTDGDGNVETVVQTGESAQGTPARITFSDLEGGGYVIAAEQTVTFEVHADIASSLNGSSLLLAFASGATFIEAETADRGSALSGIKLNATACASSSCDIIVTTTASKTYTLVNQGDLFVSRDPSPIRSRQLLGGTLGDSILRLKFRAQNESIDVTDLQLSSSGSNASSIDRLELYKDGATSPFAIATTGGCGSDDVLTTNPGNGAATIATFCANMENRQLVIAKGTDIAVTVRPRLKTDDQGATSGQDIQLFLTSQAVADNNTGSGAVRARGDQSSNNLTANNGDSDADGEVFIGREAPATTNAAIVGNINDVVLAKITSITNANPDADNTNVPTGLSPIGQFRFTAATNTNSLNGLNRATLSGVIFNVTATNVAITSSTFQFYNKADSSTKADCDPITSGGTDLSATASGSYLVRCEALESSSVNTEISSGQSVTFVLEADITNSKIVGTNTSTLQVTLQDFTDRADTTFTGTTSHLEWNDEDTSVTVFNWIEYADTQVKSTSYKS